MLLSQHSLLSLNVLCIALLTLLAASCTINLASALSTRRDVIGAIGSATVAGSWQSLLPIADADDNSSAAAAASEAFSSYQIHPDASSKLDPTLTSIDPNKLTQILSKTSGNRGGAVWLGEHHNAARDHKLQAQFIQNIHQHRQQQHKSTGKNSNMAVGLEMIQLQFQPVLDAYISNQITDEELKQQVH